ncbi:MAG TPA: tetratricopeptide repeat protein [Candidatus Acidoferrum sp.]|nr:tetratricopeptide repeat protein [Candidatus Acidoferrum sp.]
MNAGALALSGLLTLFALGTAEVSSRRSEAQRTNSEHTVTFDNEIAPIIFHYCSQCHHPGEAGPFPLLTYEDVKTHGRQIAYMTQKRTMPPWLPDPGGPKFVGELRLTDEQIRLIQEWVDEGEIEGKPSDLPAEPQFAAGWELGQPDVIVNAPKPYMLSASGTDQYWNFVFRTPVDRTRWLKAIEIRPGDKRLVHHANVLVDREETGRRLEKVPGAGFGGMELIIESEAFDPDSHFLFWKPGSPPYVEPEGMALRLDKTTDLILNTHLQPSGKPELIQPTLGLYFTDKPATKHPILIQLDNDRALDIPAGDKNFMVSDDFVLPVEASVLAIYPHAHYLGKDLLSYATLPDGTKKTLIHISHWDLNWQAVYRYVTPLDLPSGTKISMRFIYDNSAENVRNPNDPPIRVRAGNRAVDEMAHLWLQVLPKAAAGSNEDPRVTIEEALAKHHIEMNPEDFEAHYNLAALLKMKGDLAGATEQFSEAVRLQPKDPTANNALGGMLLASNHIDGAITHFRTALEARPDYFDAHYNLGNALASQGDYPGALTEFRAAVELNPEDAGAQANLGSALAVTGNLKEAKQHFERALELDPKNELARENLRQVNQELRDHPD